MSAVLRIRDRLSAAKDIERDGEAGLSGYIAGLNYALRQLEEEEEPAIAPVLSAPPAPAEAAPLSAPVEVLPADVAETPRRGGHPPLWNPERDALLRLIWPCRDLTVAQMLAQINALPGREIPRATSLYGRATTLGMNTRRLDPPLPSAAPPPGDQEAEDRAEAERMAATGAGAREIADWLGRPLREVSDWVTAWRERQAKGEAA